MEALDSTSNDPSEGDLSSEPRTCFVAVIEPSDQARILLVDRGVLIGRARHCDVCVDSSATSREHARLFRDGPIHIVRDLGSKNGVFVNGTRVEVAALQHGSVLRAGGWLAVVLEARASSIREFSEIAEGLWGGSTLAAVAQQAAMAAASELNIVLEAESGGGKECFAHAVHQWSGRAGPFVAINCSALPTSLAEAELFGYQRGAFTGAERAQAGYFRAASGGTLFLDELLELPLSVQAKLLRAVERKEVVPLGASTPVPVDVRIVAASQCSPAEAVANGRIRADLFARLNGVTIRIPPLRDRREDIVPLFRRFLRTASPGAAPALSVAVAERLCRHSWPLNVRELEALAQRLVVLHGQGRSLRVEELLALLGERATSAPSAPADPLPKGTGGTEWQAFLDALAANRGNVVKSAESVGISRQRAYRLLASHPELDVSSLRRAN